MLTFIVAVVIGLVGGAVGGLLGIGGGAIFVPAMVLLLDVDQHTAQGVSLLVIVPTAVSATITNRRAGTIDQTTVRWLTPFAIAGAMAAAFVAGALDGEVLSRIFGVVATLVGLRMLVGSVRGRD